MLRLSPTVTRFLLITSVGMWAPFAATGTEVACWNFEEGSGTAASDSCGNNDGVVDGATWVSAGCGTGGALAFDGVDDWVDMGLGGLLGGTAFDQITVQACITTPGVPINEYDFSAAVADESADGEYAIGVQRDGGRAWAVIYLESLGTGVNLLGPPVDDNLCHHLALVKTATEIALYVDGAKEDSQPAVGPLLVTGPWRMTIGRKHTDHPALPFEGEIDNVRIYNSARTEAQIVADAKECGVTVSIPTVSDWGLVVMTLLVLTAGTVVLMRRRRREPDRAGRVAHVLWTWGRR